MNRLGYWIRYGNLDRKAELVIVAFAVASIVAMFARWLP